MIVGARRIGVWMDHSMAILIIDGEYDRPFRIIQSDYAPRERFEGEGSSTTMFGILHSANNETRKENKLQNQLERYYQELERALMDFDEIFLIGPAKAKHELKNRMESNLKKFGDKLIQVANANTMSENQLRAMVRDHFNPPPDEPFR